MGVLSGVDVLKDGAVRAPTYVDNIVLGAGVAKTVTAPVGATHAYFSANGNYYVRWDGQAAAVPVADVTDGSGAEVNPSVRYIGRSAQGNQTTFSIIAPAATIVAIAWARI